MKNYLLITLGHNSSAIFVDNTSGEQKIIGYEQERLSRLKADSQFPIDAINEIEHNVGFNKMKGCTILVSHWFNTHAPKFCKYFTKRNMEKLESYLPEAIKFTSSEFTHHDAHALSAHAFFKYNACEHHIDSAPHHTLVVDGFGNDEEVLSIYLSTKKTEYPHLVHRVYGYKYSLGLFYQYATSFVGMKQNQDEYKFLGYEAHIDDVLTVEQIDCLDHSIEGLVVYFLENWSKPTKKSDFRSDKAVIDEQALHEVKDFWYKQFASACDMVGIKDYTSYNARCAVAYLIQQTCEIALSQLIDSYGITNLTVVGGTFYNVKLNNKLLMYIHGTFCAMPLAGDQGAAIGMYEAEDKKDAPAFSFDNLSWGKRRLYNFEKFIRDDIHYAKISKDDHAALTGMAEMIATFVANGRLVNLVFGNMEFGPRALGNTSTIFLPSTANTAHNNHMNNRNEVMPCAPICTVENAVQLFDVDELNRVVGSDRFMICTHDYLKPYSAQYGGVMHHKTLDTAWTGRPQIVRRGSFMDHILNYVQSMTDTKCLVNTSFNAHGNPIVFDTRDIIDNFNYQCEHAEDKAHRPELFVIELV